MTEDNDHSDASPLDAFRRYVPLAVWAIVILVILVIPLKIISYGYLPGDDALRHAAKAVSGKPWPEILVLGSAFQIDHNYGWHLLLRQIYLGSHCNTEGLVLFSVVALFALVNWSALPWLKRPEAWLIALIAVALTSDLWMRFLLGRPFIVTIAGLLTILFAWQAHGSSPPKWWTAVWMARGDCRLHVRARRVVSVGAAGGGLFSGRTIPLGIDAGGGLGGGIISGRFAHRTSVGFPLSGGRNGDPGRWHAHHATHAGRRIAAVIGRTIRRWSSWAGC